MYHCWRNLNNLQVHKLQNKTRNEFGEKEKQEIVKLVSEHGHTATVTKFKKKLSTLTESTIWPLVKRYKENLKEKRKANKEVALKIGPTCSQGVLIGLGESYP